MSFSLHQRGNPHKEKNLVGERREVESPGRISQNDILLKFPLGFFLYQCGIGRSVFRSCFQIILAGVLSLSLGSTDITGIFLFGIHCGFGPPPSQSLFTI